MRSSCSRYCWLADSRLLETRSLLSPTADLQLKNYFDKKYTNLIITSGLLDAHVIFI